MSKRKKVDWFDVWVKVICIAILLGIIALVIWIRAFMPCSWIDWMPVQELPGRCLAVDVR